MKHKHEADNGFIFRSCPECGASAMSQKVCKKCGKMFCEKCEALKNAPNKVA